LETTVETQGQTIAELSEMLDNQKSVSRQLQRELDDQINRNMRDNNLVFSGVPQELDKEPWGDTKEKIKKILVEQLGLTDIFIDRAHRKYVRRAGNTYNVDIVARIPFTDHRDQIWQNVTKLKGTTIFINQQFSKRVEYARYRLRPKLKQAREQGKDASMQRDMLRIDNRSYVYDEELDDIVEYRLPPHPKRNENSNGRGKPPGTHASSAQSSS
jgi:uncharacterized coiled-coil protein SlyX